jgi:5-methylthioadenosine/S-adenosylhomocysteine deaminase
VQFDASDVALAAHYGCPVAHCPASNAKLGHGVAPLRALLDAGVVVGLGTDSVASNNRLDLLDEARVAVLQQRAARASAAALDAGEALGLATLGGARALGLEAHVGSLVPGKDADLAVFRLDGDAADPLGARGVHAGGPEAALVFALAGRPASYVAVRGVARVRDGRVLGLDPGLRARVADAAARLAAWAAAAPAERSA